MQPEPGSVAQWIAHWTSSEQWKKAIQRLWVRVPPESCAFKDVCLFNYSPPLYQLSYRRSWRWSGQDLLLCPSHDPKRVFILAPHTVSKTCHKLGLSRWGAVSLFVAISTSSFAT